MSTKHTPGPWFVLSEQGAVGPTGSDWKMTASVYGDHPDCEPDERQAANARLIAAAPELLEALILMVQQFTKTPSTLKDSQARVKAHAAIAKAIGEQA